METSTGNVEKYVIGAVIQSGNMAAAHILQPKHFSDLNYRKIWEKLLAMYPTKHIDFVTICNEFQNDKQMVLILAECTSVITGNEHIGSHARIMIERYVRRLFIETIEKAQVAETDTARQLILKSILEDLREPQIDIFLAIDATYNILNKNNFPKHILNKIYAFKSNIDNGIKELLQNNLKTSLFGYLERLVWNNSNDLEIVRKLKEKYAAR